MRITADTNLLLRAVVIDHATQTAVAVNALAKAELVALTNVALCEFVWVMRNGYKIPPDGVARAIKTLLAAENVVSDEPAVKAGLTALEAGGDFADGIIAYEGENLGGNMFVSFDRKAVTGLTARGTAATLLA